MLRGSAGGWNQPKNYNARLLRHGTGDGGRTWSGGGRRR